jgi:lantibiotic biosynthesis protein
MPQHHRNDHRTTPWQPVLDGALADRARIALARIVDTIAVQSLDHSRPEQTAVFWGYVVNVFNDARFEEAYASAIERVVGDLRPDADPGLYGGLAGAGWALAHVSDGEDDAVLRWVDEVLLDTVATSGWHGAYDLVQGLTGIGLYFLEREAVSAAARHGLARVVGHLALLAERTPDGLTWHTRSELLPEWQRAHCPAGQYNCGVAHGVPGVIAFLARVGDPAATALCREAMQWMRAQDLGPDPRGRFPAWIAPTRASARTRAAWCYGDPGVACALWSAAVRIGAPDEDWYQLAVECAERPVELCDVVDPYLCHGAIGLAHLANRFYQASGDARFRDAARAWFDRGLALYEDAPPPRVAHDLLEGAAGVGLALLAAIDSTEPGWDRLLLADLPKDARDRR